MNTQTTELKKLLDHAVESAQEIFKSSGEVLPMWLLDTSRGIVPVVTPWGSPEEKLLTVAAMKTMMRLSGATRYALMTEAWTVRENAENLDGFAGSLANHPDRREIVLVQVEDKTSMMAAILYILRPETGKPTLSEPKILDDAAATGGMAGLLREPQSLH